MAGEDTQAPDSSFGELDDLIDHRFDEAARAAEGEDAPGPASDDEPAGSDDDTEEITDDPDLYDDDDLDEEDEELGEEELDEDEDFDDDEEYEEDEEDEEDEEEGEEDEENVFESISAEELEEINNDPKLKKVYRSMQAAFTKKTTDLSQKDRRVSRRESQVEEFVNDVRTADGMAGFLKTTLEKNPDIVAAAFEAVAFGDKATDFLLEVGLEDPEVFEEAYNRLGNLLSDDDALKRHKKARELETREARADEREQRLRRQNFDRDYDRLLDALDREAQRQDIPKDDLKDVQQRIYAKIRESVKEDGKIPLKAEDVKAIVKDYRKHLDQLEKRVLRRHNRKRVKDNQEATKRKARKGKGKKRNPPRSRGRKPPKERTKFSPPENVDPLDAYVDHRLEA